MARKKAPKVIKAWWSEAYAKMGEEMTLNAITTNAAGHTLKFQVYEFRRRSKPLKEISIPVHQPEISAKWKVAYKTVAAESGNPEFKFKARVEKSSKASNTLYTPAELEIALTFDDGPALPRGNQTAITDELLVVLSRLKIKATFFVEHSRIVSDYGKKTLIKMISNGHEIGIHGVDPAEHHVKHQDTKNFKAKIETMSKLIKSITGASPKYIRPPGGWGGWNKGVYLSKGQLREIYREFNILRYNGAGTDGTNSWGAEVGRTEFWPEIEKKIAEASKGNPRKLVILAHDLRSYDVKNLPAIVEKVQARADIVKAKITFVAMSEIAKGWKGA